MNRYYIILLAILCSCSTKQTNWQEHAQRVEDAYAYLKTYRQLPTDVDLEAEAAYLLQADQARYAGEAYYILGAAENLIGQDTLAMYHLKQAEKCWQKEPNSPASLQGMTYYKEGRISENEQLREVALHHYRQALPYLQQAGDSLYLSAVYREIGRMSTDSAEREQCFAQAIQYAQALSEELQLDTRYAVMSAMGENLTERVAISQTLCDSAGMTRYAADVIRAALRENDTIKAKAYLCKLATDTTNLVWSRNQYLLLHAQYLYQIGETTQAYNALSQLYELRLGALDQESAARSYTIAERFDNASEREKNLVLGFHQQRLELMLTLLFSILLLGAGIITSVLLYHRSQRQLQVAHEQIHINTLQSTIAKQLRQQLIQRHSQKGAQGNVFEDERYWKRFMEEYDAAHDKELSKLMEQYPSLTTADLQVIALSNLGLSNSEICLLLNQTKQSVWNRRQRIKTHMQQ